MAKFKKNDQVIVITGKDRGKIGKIVEVLAERNRVIVEKINIVKRHTKPSAKNPQGGVVEKELSIHVSNIMIVDPKSGERSRVGFRRSSDGKKERFSKKSGELIEAK